jgi:hypothetical protein
VNGVVVFDAVEPVDRHAARIGPRLPSSGHTCPRRAGAAAAPGVAAARSRTRPRRAIRVPFGRTDLPAARDHGEGAKSREHDAQELGAPATRRALLSVRSHDRSQRM